MKEQPYSRWLAVGLLLLTVAFFVLAILVPLITNGFAYHDEIDELAFRLQRQEKIAAHKDIVAKNLEKIKHQFQEQNYFSNRDTEALASADLQNIVKTAVTDAGGQLTSTQGLPGKVVNGFNRVAVRVRMSSSMEALRTVLHSLAVAVPILIIDQIDITPLRTPQRGKNKFDPVSQLNVSFEVVSFMRVGQ